MVEEGANKTVGAPTVGDDQQPKEFVRPPFTPFQDILDAFNYLMWNPEANAIAMPVLILLESIAMKFIQNKVSYTEIDYTAYMEQIWMIQNGERDYSQIKGGTGPLVYPAGHVFIYKIFEWVSDGLENISEAQDLFRYLYVITLMIQFMCFGLLNIPPGYAIFAILSKRLHSVYVLRLFNDCFTTLFMSLAVLVMILCAKYKIRGFLVLIGSSFYSMAVSIKMNALLYLPGVLLTIYLLERCNTFKIVLNLAVMVIWQVIIAIPFWKEYPWEYLQSAFNFSRQFMYKWSVNWQMVNEEVFLDPLFHRSLLISHVIVLVVFLFYKLIPTNMNTPAGLLKIGKANLLHPFTDAVFSAMRVNAEQIAYILLVTNYIGVLFARSLHYQFLSWYHWTLPVLLNWANVPYPLCVLWYLTHEWCWNSYPPNATASTLLHACNTSLLLAVFLRGPANSKSGDNETTHEKAE